MTASARVAISLWLRGRLPVLFAGAAALLLAGALAIAVWRGIGGPELGATDTGFETAADFTLPTFDGGSFTPLGALGQARVHLLLGVVVRAVRA